MGGEWEQCCEPVALCESSWGEPEIRMWAQIYQSMEKVQYGHILRQKILKS